MNEVARMTKQVHDTNDVILLKIKSDNRQDYAKHDNPFDSAKPFNCFSTGSPLDFNGV